MICPACGSSNDRVLDSRASSDGFEIRRRRECTECNYRFSTIERIEGLVPKVVKKDGTKQAYNETKILNSLMVACSKRPVTEEEMQAIVSAITDEVNNNPKREISSRKIGEYIMEQLYVKDKVAYVRFASVYKDFTNPESFAEEVKKISGETL